MAFSLTFHSLEEKIPAHGQQIAFFDTRYIKLKYGNVYYVWDNGDGTQWTYDGEEEFIYDDGTKPEEKMQLIFCIEHDNAGWEYGPVSNIKEYFRKRFHWTDYNQLTETVPEDDGVLK